MEKFKTLTVKELKDLLDKYSDDMPVMIEGDEYYYVTKKSKVEDFDEGKVLVISAI